MKCLMVAFAFVLPYHVLRTASAAGHTVHVIGNGPSRGLRYSRHVASYHQLPVVPSGDRPQALVREIDEIVRRHDVDVILPSDDVSTRLLARLHNDLPAPTSLLPDVAAFDLLNDKWSFTQFCLDHGVRVPEGWHFRDVGELRDALGAGALRLPLTAKPLSCSGGLGVLHLREPADLPLLYQINYSPILVQRHIRGETIGISVVCRQGKILTHATQRRDDHRFELFTNPDLLQNVERLVDAVNYTGPANFDAVLEDGTGANYIVECNPRFWYTIYMPMLLGLNFVDVALRERPTAPMLDGRLRLSFGDILHQPSRMDRLDRTMLRYHLGDPLPYLFQRRHWFDDRDVNVRPEEMTSHPAVADGSDAAVPRPRARLQSAPATAENVDADALHPAARGAAAVAVPAAR